MFSKLENKESKMKSFSGRVGDFPLGHMMQHYVLSSSAAAAYKTSCEGLTRTHTHTAESLQKVRTHLSCF